jgi:hypothetical protein
MIRTVCPNCRKPYAFQFEFAGRLARCEKCGDKFPIPKDSDNALEEAEFIPETLDDAGKSAYEPIPDWVQKPNFPIEASK